MKIISDRIFELLKERGMTQKEFSSKTGIAESTISDWKKKRTNPVSDKILIISEVLGVSPHELLSGAEHSGERSRENQVYVISQGTELGILVETYQNLDSNRQKRLMIWCVFDCDDNTNAMLSSETGRISAPLTLHMIKFLIPFRKIS